MHSHWLPWNVICFRRLSVAQLFQVSGRGELFLCCGGRLSCGSGYFSGDNSEAFSLTTSTIRVTIGNVEEGVHLLELEEVLRCEPPL